MPSLGFRVCVVGGYEPCDTAALLVKADAWPRRTQLSGKPYTGKSGRHGLSRRDRRSQVLRENPSLGRVRARATLCMPTVGIWLSPQPFSCFSTPCSHFGNPRRTDLTRQKLLLKFRRGDAEAAMLRSALFLKIRKRSNVTREVTSDVLAPRDLITCKREKEHGCWAGRRCWRGHRDFFFFKKNCL